MKTAIVTDKNSWITVEEGRAEGIYVIAMPVDIDAAGIGVSVVNG